MTHLLLPPQLEILNECLERTHFGLSLPMGSGKTLISLVYGLIRLDEFSHTAIPLGLRAQKEKPLHFNNKILIVAAKSLISSWELEINKFFNRNDESEGSTSENVVNEGSRSRSSVTLKYQIINDRKNKIKTDTQVVFITPSFLTKFYTNDPNIASKFIDSHFERHGPHNNLMAEVVDYFPPIHGPYSEDPNNFFFNCKWNTLIIDEAQTFTNIETRWCRALCSICAQHKLLLSGTMFPEPKPQRILGYHLLIQSRDFPNNLPEAIRFIHSWTFRGIRNTLVYRFTNEMVKDEVYINQQEIQCTMSEEENILYMIMRNVLRQLNAQIRTFLMLQNTAGVRRFNSYLLAMITMLRQSLVCPLIPISKIALDMLDYSERKSDLSTIFNRQLVNSGLSDWLNDPNSICSSRIKEIMSVARRHNDERIIVFTCYRTSVDILMHFLKDLAPVFTLTSSQNIDKRGQVIEDFNKSSNGILILTYQLGSEGLNLQISHTMLLTDFSWNSSVTQQAVSRIARYGQECPFVNIYYFVCVTGIEKAVFNKQIDKNRICQELMTGRQVTTLRKLRVNDIVNMIIRDEVDYLFRQLY
jgi:SNF2 family DNA or RNA helicase